MSTEQEYLQSVDQFLAVYHNWQDDPDAPVQPSVEFEDSIVSMFKQTLSGDVPVRCRKLNRYLEDLYEEWKRYADRTAMDRQGCPLASFWQMLGNVMTARQQSDGFRPKRREPVKVLLDQKVPYPQIAGHIWGYRGDGPLCTNGHPDIEKIHAEAEKPGSVIPPDWVHPEDRMLMDGTDEAPIPRRRLDVVERKQAWTDEQVLDLLHEGANIKQLVNVSGRTEDDITALAKAHGETIKPLANLASERAPHEPTYDQAAPILSESPRPQEIEPEALDVDDIIREYAEDGSMGEPEIARLVSEQCGKPVTVQKVKSVLRKAKATA